MDRKARSRVPISAKLVANLITAAGANRVLTIDLHSAQEQGFFDIPVDNLYARKAFVDFLKKSKFNSEDFVVMGSDAGAAKLAESYAQRLGGLALALAYKTRTVPNQAKVLCIVGDVKDKNVLLVDDMIDTAGTIIANTERLKEMGARHIYAACTHGLFSKNAISRIEASALERVFVTDSIPLKEDVSKSSKIEVISIAPLLAEAIRRAHNNESVSSLFE